MEENSNHMKAPGAAHSGLGRREIMLGGLALGAALPATPLLAQAKGGIVAEEHWAQKGESKLYIYRKKPDQGTNHPVVVLVHGSTFSGRGGFDLQVPGLPDYSLMDYLARQGFDVWSPDHEGYGRSSRPLKFIGINEGVEDLKISFDLIEKVTGVKAPMVSAQSSGAIRAALFAARHPDRVERLILDAFTFTGKDAPEIQRRRERAAELKANPVRKLTRATFHGIFTRDDPSTFVPAVADALADYELKLGDTAPSGPYLDMALNLPMNEPEAVKCPVCMTRAEHDGNATEAELFEYFARLPNPDKQFHKIRGIAHVAVLGINRHRVWHVMNEFFTLPALRSA